MRVRSKALVLCFSSAVSLGVLGCALGVFSPQRASAAGMTVQSNVRYGLGGTQPLLADVYLPTGSGTHPAIVLIHPGGFVGGDKADPDVVKVASFYAEKGYVVFSIDYRLARQDPYPAAVDDAKQAVGFVRANAAAFHVDADRIAAFGASAGASIAAEVGMGGQGTLNTGERVAAVVSWSGALDMWSVAEQNVTAAEGLYTYMTGENGQKLDREGQLDITTVESQLRAASPIASVDASDPPMFIANSPSEFMPLNQAQAMADALKSVGVPYELFTDTGGGHALAYTDAALEPTLSFLRDHLDGYQPQPKPSGTGSSNPQPTSDTTGPAAGSGGHQASSGHRSSGGALPFVIAGGALLALVASVAFFVQRRRTEVHRP